MKKSRQDNCINISNFHNSLNILKELTEQDEHMCKELLVIPMSHSENTCMENSISPISKILACRKEAGKRFSKAFHKSNSMDDLEITSKNTSMLNIGTKQKVAINAYENSIERFHMIYGTRQIFVANYILLGKTKQYKMISVFSIEKAFAISHDKHDNKQNCYKK